MSEESDNLFLLAEGKLDQHDFAGARDAYREAALTSLPSNVDLGNLSIAEASECTQFRRELIQKYPDSLDVLLSEVECMINARYYENAVRRCDELLAHAGLSDGQISQIRHNRLLAAVQGSSADGFASNILAILKFDFVRGLRLPKSNRLKRAVKLARYVMPIKRPEFVGQLAIIRGALDDKEPEEKLFIDIITNKINELEAFKTLQEHLKNMRT
jgi:hypothetical protein